ncbi:hypothetical protein FKP32DRAFT_1676993 [Trametes sanguinea]|nr:hypothetical protein FKP32DRAFT_1676993 [Trametes sanguinea]
MSLSALTSAVIGLEVSNVALLSLLLATPAPKHPMVKSLMIACMVRSVLDVLPPIAEKASPHDFSEPGLNSRMTLVSFCVSDSVLLRYITVVKAAFAVSFTLPALWLSIIQIQPKRSADDYPRLTRGTVLILCIAPFVWALPVLLVAVPRLIKGEDLWVWYQINTCYFDDNAFTIVSLVFTLVPLALAVFISASVAFVLRWSRVHSQRSALRSGRSLRFGALVFVTIVSASLYAAVLVKWIKEHKVPWNSSPAEPLRLLIRTSVIWEAITPFLFFLIFAAQEEIYETWLGWLSRLLPLTRREHNHPAENSNDRSQYTVTFDSYISPNAQTAYSRVPLDAEAPGRRNPHLILPGKILPRQTSSSFLRQAFTNDRRRQGPTLSIAEPGLSPPPRPHLTRPRTAEESPRTSRFRFPFIQNLSLSAFGSQPSMRSQMTSTFAGEFSGDDGGMATMTLESGERAFGDLQRSDTPLSTRTFGRAPPTRR